MSKHTPGPWEFELYSSGGFEIYSPEGSHRKSLLVIASRGSHSAVEEMHANARLIKAAPLMLEALEGFANIGEYRELREAMANCLRSHERAGFLAGFEKAIAAIRAAKGEA